MPPRKAGKSATAGQSPRHRRPTPGTRRKPGAADDGMAQPREASNTAQPGANEGKSYYGYIFLPGLDVDMPPPPPDDKVRRPIKLPAAFADFTNILGFLLAHDPRNDRFVTVTLSHWGITPPLCFTLRDDEVFFGKTPEELGCPANETVGSYGISLKYEYANGQHNVWYPRTWQVSRGSSVKNDPLFYFGTKQEYHEAADGTITPGEVTEWLRG